MLLKRLRFKMAEKLTNSEREGISESFNSEEKASESSTIIEKIEDKAKEIGKDIKKGFKETVEEIKEGVENIEEGAKKIIHTIEGKDDEPTSEEEAEEHKQKEIEKSHSRHHPVKEKAVNKLVDKMQHAKTIMVINIKGLPSKQFQEIKKAIREYAEISVAKKNIIIRAIEKFGKKSIVPLKKNILENCALAISDMEGYELAGILSQKKTPVAAKAGQEAPEDIKVMSGPTDLVPGPAISELGAIGLQVAVEGGKLSIKKSKVVVTKGQTINETTASILQKLNIMPFTVGLEPLAVYDVQEEKIYTDIKVDSEKARASLINAAGKSLGFAQKIIYYCKETIGYLLAKANADGNALGKLKPKEESKEKEASSESKVPETSTNDTDIKSEEEK